MLLKPKNKMYIIGNGFDLYHGVKSRYSDFEKYIQYYDNQLYNQLNDLFDSKSLWSYFEETLAKIDLDSIIDEVDCFLVSYDSESWGDSSHHDYSKEIDQIVSLVTVELKIHFTNWINGVVIPNIPVLNLDKEAIFLNFNYTETLELAYQIPAGNINYIHNKVKEKSSELILGHGWDPKKYSTYASLNDENTDVRIAEGNMILDRYFVETYKNTASLIVDNQSFFNDLNQIQEIYVFGHSMSSVDIDYFKIIKSKIYPTAKWKVSYYGDDQKQKNLNKLLDIGVLSDKIEMIRLDSLKI